jgi:hypothetical protein
LFGGGGRGGGGVAASEEEASASSSEDEEASSPGESSAAAASAKVGRRAMLRRTGLPNPSTSFVRLRTPILFDSRGWVFVGRGEREEEEEEGGECRPSSPGACKDARACLRD